MTNNDWEFELEKQEKAIKADVASLVGKTIVGANWDKSNEGVFTLVLSDGRIASFSSTGDDMTFTSLSIEVIK